MSHRPVLRLPGRLQWKLVFSYTLVTALAFFIVIVLVLIVAVTILPPASVSSGIIMRTLATSAVEQIGPALQRQPLQRTVASSGCCTYRSSSPRARSPSRRCFERRRPASGPLLCSSPSSPACWARCWGSPRRVG